MTNEEFELPRLAAVYDLLEDDRRDLAPYEALVHDSGARRVLDVGCGTGVLALRLAAAGVEVVGVDPAAASLDVARRKPGADRVTWIEGGIGAVDEGDFDLVVLTGNTAQQFVADDAWRELLDRAHALLRPGGRLVLETRDPAARAWEHWTAEATRAVSDLPGVGPVETWTEVLRSAPPLLAFRTTWAFAVDGAVLASESTLRFRGEPEVRRDLAAAGFGAVDLRDAPDRPGLELVFSAERGA